MDMLQIYIMVVIVILLVIGVVIFFTKKNKKDEGFGTLAGIAFGFIILGIIFGENRWFAYCLMGIGVALAIVDIIMKNKVRNRKRS